MGVREESDRGGPVVLLRAPGGPHRVGQPVPLAVEVRNDGPGELWMVGVVDGSEEGVRPPRYRPSVTRAGTLVAAPPPPEDPLVGPLRAADFRRLAPGEAFDPTRPEGGAGGMPLATFANFRPDAPATYRFELVLSTESGAPEEWLGRFGQDEPERARVLDLVGRVPQVTLTASVDVEVR